MGNILAILDSDRKYVCKLSLFLEKKKEIPFEIQGFDSSIKLCNYLKEHTADVLLVENKSYTENMKEMVGQIILFVDKRTEECLDVAGIREAMPAICKYQSGDSICKKLLGICAVIQSETVSFNIGSRQTASGCEIIGVYSPVKRCLQTSFAFIYSRIRANCKKTLYLNFEVFSGFSAWFQKEYQTDLMDLMYFLGDDSERFLLKLAGMTEEFGNVKYIPPAFSYEDFITVRAEQWMKLIDTLAKKSGYEVLVLDLGDQMQGLFEILSMCDKVYTIIKPDGVAMAKVADYEKMLRTAGRDSVLQKTVKCRLPVFKEIPQEINALSYSQLADYMKNKMGEETQYDENI